MDAPDCVKGDANSRRYSSQRFSAKIMNTGAIFFSNIAGMQWQSR
ncbi:hypothetical protein [Methylomonas albis]|nr:hypothetical protein [Methylomonas albis]